MATMPLCLKLGYVGLAISVASGFLWMFGGTYWKPIRRIGIPILIALTSYYLGAVSLVVALMVGGILHLGDGFPDHRPSTADPGSWLGRQVETIIPDPDLGGEVTKWIPVVLVLVAIRILFI